MTANQNKNRDRNGNKKGRRLKNNRLGYIIEALVLIVAAIFLSAVGSAPFIDPLSLICTAAAAALFACVLFLIDSRIIIFAGVLSFAVTFLISRDLIEAAASLTYIIIGAFIYFGIKTRKNKNKKPPTPPDSGFFSAINSFNSFPASYTYTEYRAQLAEKLEKLEKLERLEKSEKSEKTEPNYYKRTQITAAIACFLSLFYAVMLAVSVTASAGGFSISEIEAVIDGYLTGGINIYADHSQSLSQYMASLDPGQAVNFIESYKKEIFINMKAILPACYIIYNLFAAYLTTAMFKIAYNIFIPMANHGRKRIKNKYWRINMSVVSAVVMITSIFLAVMFTSQENLLPAIVMTNLIYILVPGFCVMGVYFACDKMTNSGASALPVVLIVCAVALSAIYPFVIVAVIAVCMALGLYAALIGDIRKFYEKTKKLLFGDEDDDDFID